MFEAGTARGRGGGAIEAHCGGSVKGSYRVDLVLRGPGRQGVINIGMYLC